MLSSLLLHLLQFLCSLGCPQLAAVSHTHQVPLSRGGSVSRLNWLWGRREKRGHPWKAMVGWIVNSDVNAVLDLVWRYYILGSHCSPIKWLVSSILMFERKPITLVMAATNMECHRGKLLYTRVLERYSFMPFKLLICHTTSNQSWTWEWPRNEANEVIQQLNQSAPDAQSVHIVTMEVACQ